MSDLWSDFMGTVNDINNGAAAATQAVSAIDKLLSGASKTIGTVGAAGQQIVSGSGLNVPVSVSLDSTTKTFLIVGGILLAVLLGWAILK
jgi:hypothetical protein